MNGMRVAPSEVREVPVQAPQPKAPVLALLTPQPHHQAPLYQQGLNSFGKYNWDLRSCRNTLKILMDLLDTSSEIPT